MGKHLEGVYTQHTTEAVYGIHEKKYGELVTPKNSSTKYSQLSQKDDDYNITNYANYYDNTLMSNYLYFDESEIATSNDALLQSYSMPGNFERGDRSHTLSSGKTPNDIWNDTPRSEPCSHNDYSYPEPTIHLGSSSFHGLCERPVNNNSRSEQIQVEVDDQLLRNDLGCHGYHELESDIYLEVPSLNDQYPGRTVHEDIQYEPTDYDAYNSPHSEAYMLSRHMPTDNFDLPNPGVDRGSFYNSDANECSISGYPTFSDGKDQVMYSMTGNNYGCPTMLSMPEVSEHYVEAGGPMIAYRSSNRTNYDSWNEQDTMQPVLHEQNQGPVRRESIQKYVRMGSFPYHVPQRMPNVRRANKICTAPSPRESNRAFYSGYNADPITKNTETEATVPMYRRPNPRLFALGQSYNIYSEEIQLSQSLLPLFNTALLSSPNDTVPQLKFRPNWREILIKEVERLAGHTNHFDNMCTNKELDDSQLSASELKMLSMLCCVLAKAASQLPTVRGVYLDRKRSLWRGNWRENGRVRTRGFTQKKEGDHARNMAITARKLVELKTCYLYLRHLLTVPSSEPI